MNEEAFQELKMTILKNRMAGTYTQTFKLPLYRPTRDIEVPSGYHGFHIWSSAVRKWIEENPCETWSRFEPLSTEPSFWRQPANIYFVTDELRTLMTLRWPS